MKEYLESSEVVNWQHADIKSMAEVLATGAVSKIDVARRCFEFVRDDIKHSLDFSLNPVTLRASDVLQYKTGVCYAKSHLLAAVLRANGIPCALLYQRLHVQENEYCLHGLNALWLENYGWYRVDARGNKANVDAQFCPPMEKLAFRLNVQGEIDSHRRHSRPLQAVIDRLSSAITFSDLDLCLVDDAALV